ncbi:MAG: DUF11 domain-containing protein [Planctomycetes bacterium]|nr:DUF11 domain-containing protein [Planctomycetota bacterium]
MFVASAATPIATLGNLVFHDLNNNGIYEPADLEAGVDGVTVNLYTDDGTTSGSLDAGDSFVATTTTAGGGHYLFTDLPDGEYVVQIDPSNFAPGGALEGYVSSTGNGIAPDPDDDVNGDDNGSPVAGLGVASQAVTLAVGFEPDALVDGDDTDVNSTVDFGFSIPADLSLDLSASLATPAVGTNVVFTLTVHNEGPAAAGGIQVTDLLPAGLAYVSDDGGGAYDDTTGIWTIGTLANGASATLQITAQVNALSPIANDAEVTASGEADSDSTPGDGSGDDYDSATVTPQYTDLQVSVAESEDPAQAGSNTVVYTITLANVGNVGATNIELENTLTLPSGTSIFFVNPSTGDVTSDADSNTWTLASLAAGEDKTLAVTVAVGPSTAHGAVIVCAPAVTALDEDDPVSSNDSDSESTTVYREADLKVTVVDFTDPVVAGSNAPANLVYQISVENLGPSDASGIVIATGLTLPSGVTFKQALAEQGTYGGSPDGDWTLGALAAGADKSLTIVLFADAGAAAATDAISLQAEVDAVNETDTAAANDTDTESTSITREVDLVVTVAESADPVTAGSGAGNLVYTVTVTNNGPSNASGVTLDVTPTMPSGVTLDDSDASAGGYTGGTWSLGSLASGGSATLTLTATVGPSAAHGSSASCATSNLAANEPLIETGDDADTESTAIQRRIDLALTKIAGESMPAVGADVTYTLTVTNHGPSDASGVEVTDLLPAGLAYVSDDGGGDYDDATGIWTIGALADGAQAQLDLTATVTVSGEIVNSAQISDADETDTDSTPDNGTENGEDDEAEAPVGAAYIGDAGWKILSAKYTLNIPKAPGFDSLTLQAKLEFAALQAAGLNLANLGAQTFQLDFGGAELPAAPLAATSVSATQVSWQTARGVTPKFSAKLNLGTGLLTVSASSTDLLTSLGAPFVAAPQTNAPQPIAVTLSLGTFNSTVVLLTSYTRKSATATGTGSFKWGSALNDWPDGLFFVDKASIQQRTSKGVVLHRALLTLNFLPAGGADFDPRAGGARLVIGDFSETVGNDPLLAPFIGNASGTIFSYRRPSKNTLGAAVPPAGLQLMQFQKLKWLVTATSHWLPAGTFGTPQTGIGAPPTILLPLELEVDGQISGTESLLRLKGSAYQK